jgi:hypothetical protein
MTGKTQAFQLHGRQVAVVRNGADNFEVTVRKLLWKAWNWREPVRVTGVEQVAPGSNGTVIGFDCASKKSAPLTVDS